MNIQEVQKNLEKTIKQLESYNNDFDLGFSALLQMLSSLLVILFSFLENIQISYSQQTQANKDLHHALNEQTQLLTEQTNRICILEKIITENKLSNNLLRKDAFGGNRRETNKSKINTSDKTEKKIVVKKKK